MAGDENIIITDRAAFPGKIDAIKKAAAELRTVTGELAAIVDKAREEAASFTADGKPAPIYDPVISGLQKWAEAAKPAIEAVVTGADNCADTAKAKFVGITTTDDDTAETIKDL